MADNDEKVNEPNLNEEHQNAALPAESFAPSEGKAPSDEVKS